MIRIEQRPRPLAGMGSASPRYELYTSCCGIFLAADNSLEQIMKRGIEARDGVDSAKLVIYDRDGLCAKCGGALTTECTIKNGVSSPVYRICSQCGERP